MSKNSTMAVKTNKKKTKFQVFTLLTANNRLTSIDCASMIYLVKPNLESYWELTKYLQDLKMKLQVHSMLACSIA
jgi:hypothetical protein